MLETIKEKFGLTAGDPKQYSPLSLAFIGDSVFGAVAKSVVVLRGNCPANDLDKKSVNYIRAISQSLAVDRMLADGLLSDEELAVYKRGRNAKSPTPAKNAPLGDYRKATGLEAVIGYVYLKGDMERVTELVRIAVETIDGGVSEK